MESQEDSDDVTLHAQPVNALHTVAGGCEARGEETFLDFMRRINRGGGYGIDTQALFQEDHERMLLEEYMKNEEQKDPTHAPSPVAADPLVDADATSAPSKQDPGPSPLAAGRDAEATAGPKSAPPPAAAPLEGGAQATAGPKSAPPPAAAPLAGVAQATAGPKSAPPPAAAPLAGGAQATAGPKSAPPPAAAPLAGGAQATAGPKSAPPPAAAPLAGVAQATAGPKFAPPPATAPLAGGAQVNSGPKSAPPPLTPARIGAAEATMGPDPGEKGGDNQPAPVDAHANAAQATTDAGDVGEVCGHVQTLGLMQRGKLMCSVRFNVPHQWKGIWMM
ncbi:unnamed protein product [Closterium sp. Yama58-4]|nr:unnamed protein product [Closterium sp. Yama58-4]